MNLEHLHTERLWLDRPAQGDLGDLHRIHADPESWAHFPQGRHVDLERTQQAIDKCGAEWAHGLGYWCVRESENGPVIGMAGCAVVSDQPWWNLWRTAEKAGLTLVWRGPDAGNEDPDAVRLVYLDREPDDAIEAAIEHRFTPRSTV